MKLDTFVALIGNLRKNAQDDDVDPNNVSLSYYASPYDNMSTGESVRCVKSTTCVWGDGTTYTAYDNKNQPFQTPSCGWSWNAGGKWS